MMATDSQLISQTQCWVKSVVIDYNLCPFAKYEYDKGSIRYQVISHNELSECLHAVIDECVHLDSHKEIETTLLILSNTAVEFDDYLQLVDMAERLLVAHHYEGVYQLASFHPDYVFADSTIDDAANYTNRSPYPMIHLLREASLEKALERLANPESIPERNIDYMRSLGCEVVKAKLDACCPHKEE